MFSKVGFSQINLAKKNVNFGDLTITKGKNNHQKLHELQNSLLENDKFDVKKGHTRIRVAGSTDNENELKEELREEGYKVVENHYGNVFNSRP